VEPGLSYSGIRQIVDFLTDKRNWGKPTRKWVGGSLEYVLEDRDIVEPEEQISGEVE